MSPLDQQPTWVWVLQLFLEAGEGRAERLWELQEHLVHDQHSLLTQVRPRRRHLPDHIKRKVKNSSQPHQHEAQAKLVRSMVTCKNSNMKVNLNQGVKDNSNPSLTHNLGQSNKVEHDTQLT